MPHFHESFHTALQFVMMVNLILCCAVLILSAHFVASELSRAPIVLGNEVLRENNYEPLIGKRIGKRKRIGFL